MLYMNVNIQYTLQMAKFNVCFMKLLFRKEALGISETDLCSWFRLFFLCLKNSNSNEIEMSICINLYRYAPYEAEMTNITDKKKRRVLSTRFKAYMALVCAMHYL
ncbi:hypothetical protein T4D_16357 [Trichinella pseudospiralis]|uniref:Uncharacterized protein n=1 Tax=Trichinella pseudospiralis TaxID=6337 RepID=A0A0V1F8Q2_TRIPS|nr:hypothetical protein T4D_16357 [Trichinella pseudospiralis]